MELPSGAPQPRPYTLYTPAERGKFLWLSVLLGGPSCNGSYPTDYNGKYWSDATFIVKRKTCFDNKKLP
jgi:hypothetical protein